jgi:hypothetical protein
MQSIKSQQYRVVRETTDNDQRGTSVIADTPQSAVYVARAIASRDKWPGTARTWNVYLDTKQWHAVYSEPE